MLILPYVLAFVSFIWRLDASLVGEKADDRQQKSRPTPEPDVSPQHRGADHEHAAFVQSHPIHSFSEDESLSSPHRPFSPPQGPFAHFKPSPNNKDQQEHSVPRTTPTHRERQQSDRGEVVRSVTSSEQGRRVRGPPQRLFPDKSPFELPRGSPHGSDEQFFSSPSIEKVPQEYKQRLNGSLKLPQHVSEILQHPSRRNGEEGTSAPYYVHATLNPEALRKKSLSQRFSHGHIDSFQSGSTAKALRELTKLEEKIEKGQVSR